MNQSKNKDESRLARLGLPSETASNLKHLLHVGIGAIHAHPSEPDTPPSYVVTATDGTRITLNKGGPILFVCGSPEAAVRKAAEHDTRAAHLLALRYGVSKPPAPYAARIATHVERCIAENNPITIPDTEQALSVLAPDVHDTMEAILEDAAVRRSQRWPPLNMRGYIEGVLAYRALTEAEILIATDFAARTAKGVSPQHAYRNTPEGVFAMPGPQGLSFRRGTVSLHLSHVETAYVLGGFDRTERYVQLLTDRATRELTRSDGKLERAECEQRRLAAEGWLRLWRELQQYVYTEELKWRVEAARYAGNGVPTP